MNYLITKHNGAVRVFALNTKEALTSFALLEEQLPEAVKTAVVETESSLSADFVTTKDLLAIYNVAADRVERAKLAKFQDKPSAMARTFPILGEAADAYDEATFLAQFGVATAAVEKPAAAPEPTKPKTVKADKAPRAAAFSARAPKEKVHPCREGTRQAALVDALAKGSTMAELRKVVPGWSDSSIKSGLYWDINSQKGYGVTAAPRADGELVYSLTYPSGLTAPLAHTPMKTKKA